MASSGSWKLSGVSVLAVTAQLSPSATKSVPLVEISAFQFLVAAFLAAMSASNFADVNPTVENWYCQATSAVLYPFWNTPLRVVSTPLLARLRTTGVALVPVTSEPSLCLTTDTFALRLASHVRSAAKG